MLIKLRILSFLSLISAIAVAGGSSFQELEAQRKVDEIMSREVVSDATFKNGAMSVFYKDGKFEYNCDFRIQNGVKNSSCEGLDSILPQVQFVSRRNFKI